MSTQLLQGPRTVLEFEDALFPGVLRDIPNPPRRLHLIGDPTALAEGLAVVGARNATPYGLGCAKRFSGIAARRGVTIVSGGARGCDSAAHRAAVEAGGKTVVVFGGGCDCIYPVRNFALFQQVIDAGGAVVSEYDWQCHPEPYMFRMRNRLIAGLSRATLIVEAGLPSGTFSTADEALSAGKEVWAVPGAITSPKSAGANYLISQGATPIISDDAFLEALFEVFGCMRFDGDAQDALAIGANLDGIPEAFRAALEALASEQLRLEDIFACVREANPSMDQKEVRDATMTGLAEAESRGIIIRCPDGRYSVAVSQRT